MTRLRGFALGPLAVVLALLVEPAAAAARSPSAQPCKASDVSQQIKTDHTSYRLGTPVKLAVIARNDSHRACIPPGLAQVAVTNPAGAEVFHSTVSFRWKSNKTWQPGKVFKWSTEWDQRNCSADTCIGASAGSYRAHGGWDEFREGTVACTITL